MAVSNLERYDDIYARMPACQIPDPIRDLYKKRFGALESELHNGEMFIDSDPDHIKAAFAQAPSENTKITGGFYYVFAHCGDWADGRKFLNKWVPFHLFNMINPGKIEDVEKGQGYYLIRVIDDRIEGTLYIILYQEYGILVGGERSLAELSVLTKGFNVRVGN